MRPLSSFGLYEEQKTSRFLAAVKLRYVVQPLSNIEYLCSRETRGEGDVESYPGFC